MLGKLLIPYCLCPPSSDGSLVEQKLENYEYHAELTGVSDYKRTLYIYILKVCLTQTVITV